MKFQRLQKFGLGALLALVPCLSKAAIPRYFFPAYSYQCQYTESSRAPASINHAAIMVATPSKIFYGEDGTSISPELIANFNQIKANDKPLDMLLIIPMDMQPSNDSASVMAQVADRSMTSFLNSESVRQSTVGQAATTVEQKMKQEVVIGGDDPRSVQHKFNFNVQAFQALAQIQYTGYLKAAIRYKIAESKVAIEMFERVYGNRDLVFSHTMGREDRLSEVSVRWTF